MSWLEDNTVVVTGASRGIGRATAVELARRGARVVLAARSAEPIGEAATQIETDGGSAEAVPCDVSDPEQVDALFERAGDVDGLVCAAAVLVKGPFDELPLEGWQRSLDVNLTGSYLCCRRAFERMRERGGGRIVTIASLSGLYGPEKFPGLAAYNVSKYGVVGLTESVAVEGREHGISAICLAPGAVDTQMLREANPDLRAGLGPDDVARTIAALLSDELVAASGAVIPLFSNA